MNFKVAIDGPAGSGKSTISKLVAKKLGFAHIDTGAMYRAVTMEALRRKIDIEQDDAYKFIDSIEIFYKGDKIYLNGEDVSKAIRTPVITKSVPEVAKRPIVREKMKSIQQKAASVGNVIMDGRDIGYNILPDADLKIFLIADIEERVKRRQVDYINAGQNITIDELKKEIWERDQVDYNRSVAPLKQVDDAIVVDTSNSTIDESVKKIVELINERMNLDGI